MSYDQYKYRSKTSPREKLKRVIWNFVWLLAFRPTPRWALSKWRVGLLKLFGAKIGAGCLVSPKCKIWAPWNLEMGELVCLADDVDCYCVDKIIIGSKVAVSQRAFLCTASHEIETYHRELIHAPISIEDHVWVCAEAFVGPGITIEHSAVIAARAVVTRNVEAYAVVGGNPARLLKQRTVTS